MFFSMILSHVTGNLVLHSFSRNVCRSYIYFFEVEVMHTLKMKKIDLLTGQFYPDFFKRHSSIITYTLFSSDIEKVCFR